MTGSAMQSLEELERLFRDQAIVPPPAVDNAPSWLGTGLSIAGVSLLVPEGDLEEIIETPTVVPIPGTKPWVLGVGAHMGGVLPVISGDAFFRRQPYTGRPREYCMVIRRAGFHFAMTLSAVARDMKFYEEQRELDHPVDEDFARFTCGGFNYRDKFLAVLDVDRLVADSDLADAAASQPDLVEDVDDE